MPGPAASAAPLRIAARDGFELAAARYAPAEGAGGGRGLVLVVPATGVKLRLYDPLAVFLAAQGFETLTWDWRGTGGSRPRSLRGFRATMTDWATRDLGGVLDWAAQHAAGRPLLAIAQSFGGQALGLVNGPPVEPSVREPASTGERDPGTGLAAVVTVAAQSGYWRHWPRPQRYLYAMLWYLAMPGLTALCGYFPAHRLGMGEDLPAGVAGQWARWCRSPDYLGDWSGHARFQAPILAYSFADDAFAPWPAVEALHRRYTSTTVEHRHLTTEAVGVPKIGHFGFFKPGLPALWREAASWLAAR
jgi:predicted alpha/beta hydrolase